MGKWLKYGIKYDKRVMGYTGNSTVSFYQQTRAGMETANISHIDVNIRINVWNGLNGGIHCVM